MRFAVLVVYFVVLAGCAAPKAPPPSCEGSDCPPTSSTSPSQSSNTTNPTDPPLPNATLPKIILENCQGVNLAASIPNSQAEEHLPDHFGPDGVAPFVGGLVVNALECPRVILLNQTLTDISVLLSFMVVDTDNTSWSEGGEAYYLYDFLVTNQTLADHLSIAAGITVRPASYSVEVTAIQDDKQTEIRTFESGALRYALTFPRDDTERQGVLDQTKYHFSGDNPYHRMDIAHRHSTTQIFSNDGGTIEVTGPSRFRDALGADQAPGFGSVYYSLTWEIEPVAKLFQP